LETLRKLTLILRRADKISPRTERTPENKGENNNVIRKVDSVSKMFDGFFYETNTNINSAKVNWAANNKLCPLITKAFTSTQSLHLSGLACFILCQICPFKKQKGGLRITPYCLSTH
jgi:hypothetical protein